MDALRIKEVATLRELRAFIRFPHRLYRDNPYWVPTMFVDDYQTLRRDKNPAFDYCEARYWLAYRGRAMVGRIAGIYNRASIEKWQYPYLRFSWVDFVDDAEVSVALFQQVESWAKEKGLTAVHGPLGFTDMDREGMLVEGFEELGTLATFYNFPYYPTHLEKLGYGKDVDWMEYEITVPSTPNATIARIANLMLRRYNLKKLVVRNKKQLLPYVPGVFKLLNDEYEHLYGVVPLTEKQIKYYTKVYFDFIKPEFVPVVLDENDAVIGFGITMPSLSKALRKADGRLLPFGFVHLLRAMSKRTLRIEGRADLYLIAVRSEYQGKGINAILMDMINQVFAERGIVKAESNPELETNTNVRGQWKYYETRQHKRRRCFIKRL